MLIRTYNVLRLLAREFDVTALCFYRAATHRTRARLEASTAALAELATIETFPIPQEHSRPRLVFDHLRSIGTRRAYTVYAYESRDFRRRLKEVLSANQFDLVHMDSLDLAGYLPRLEGTPVVCVHHNVESMLLRRRAATTTGLARLYLRTQAALTEAEERRWCPSVAMNVAVSSMDRAALERLAPGSRFTVVPNGVDTATFRPDDRTESSEGGIVFVGGYTWQPNRDAMDFFCTEVLPKLRSRGVNAPVTWVGRAPDDIVRKYAETYGVTLTGYVDDIRPIVLRAACYIAPLRAGGGTRLKILDAWAMGKAVVSTGVGCEGLDALDGQNILIRDSPESFATAVASVLENSELRGHLGAEARKTAESRYDWEVIGRPMLATYRDLCAVKVSPEQSARTR